MSHVPVLSLPVIMADVFRASGNVIPKMIVEMVVMKEISVPKKLVRTFNLPALERDIVFQCRGNAMVMTIALISKMRRIVRPLRARQRNLNAPIYDSAWKSPTNAMEFLIVMMVVMNWVVHQLHQISAIWRNISGKSFF